MNDCIYKRVIRRPLHLCQIHQLRLPKKVESKRKTYFNGESVAAKASYDNKNASNGEQPVLQIEVVYPTPNTCSMVHNPKYVGHYIEKPDNGRGKTSKSKRIRQKLTLERDSPLK
jgi:hypothetical protein